MPYWRVWADATRGAERITIEASDQRAGAVDGSRFDWGVADGGVGERMSMLSGGPCGYGVVLQSGLGRVEFVDWHS